MAKRIGSIEQFLEDVVCGVQRKSWMPEEGSEVEDICEFLLGFQEGDYIKNGVSLKHLEQDGGGEGGSEDCYTVVQFGDKYYKIAYSYYSHDGFDYSYADVYEVTPVERLVTFYE